MWAPYLQQGDKSAQVRRGQRRQAGGGSQRRQGQGARWERRRRHRAYQLGDGGTKICCMMQGSPWLQPGCAEASAGAAGGPGSSAGGDARCWSVQFGAIRPLRFGPASALARSQHDALCGAPARQGALDQVCAALQHRWRRPKPPQAEQQLAAARSNDCCRAFPGRLTVRHQQGSGRRGRHAQASSCPLGVADGGADRRAAAPARAAAAAPLAC